MSEETATITPEAPAPETTETPSLFSEGNTFADGWAEQLGEGYEGLSKFNGKGVTDLARSYSELEKKIGQKTEGMIKVPGEDATPEEIQAFHASLGVPDSIDGYEISLPEETLEGLDFDPDALGPIKEAAQRLGVTPEQLNGLVAEQAVFEKAQLEQWEQEAEADRQELVKEWGSNADRNTELAKRAAAAGGIPEDSPLMESPDVLRAFANLGAKISEGQLDSITPTTTGMTAADQARDIQTNPDNPLYKAYRGEIADRQKVDEARKMVAELQAKAIQ